MGFKRKNLKRRDSFKKLKKAQSPDRHILSESSKKLGGKMGVIKKALS